LGLAMGIGLSGLGVGGVVLTPLTQWLVDTYGWRTAMRSLSIVAGMENKSKSIQSISEAGADGLVASEEPNVLEQVQDAAGRGVSPIISGSSCLVLLNVFMALGQVLSSVAVKRLGPYKLLFFSSFLMTLGYVPLYLLSLSSPAMLAVSCCVIGLVVGPLPPDITVDVFGASDAATKLGLVFTWFAPGVFACGPILGQIADRYSIFDSDGIRVMTDWKWVVGFCGIAQSVVTAMAGWIWIEKRMK
ncbi:hypothetical protein HDU93_005088, partial [Gonapodya sp. JEL0774]